MLGARARVRVELRPCAHDAWREAGATVNSVDEERLPDPRGAAHAAHVVHRFPPALPIHTPMVNGR
jgi:hypothetical protein